MKKAILCLMLILIVSTGIVACKKSAETVTPQDSTVTVSFVVDERFLPDHAEDFSLPSVTVKTGTVLGEIAVPEQAEIPDITLIYLNELVWCFDAEGNVEYDPELPVTEDCTLYLVQKGKRYSITYHYDERFDMKGSFVFSYRFGDRVPLPSADLGEGYRPQGRWYYNDTQYYSIAIPAGASGNKELTFRPDPIVYYVSYRSGLTGVDVADVDNPNPTEWTIEQGKVMVLKPATYQGKTCTGWRIRLSQADPTFEIDGKTVTYRHLQEVTQLDFAFIQWAQFTLEPIWDGE